jgi:hypothetical protein
MELDMLQKVVYSLKTSASGKSNVIRVSSFKNEGNEPSHGNTLFLGGGLLFSVAYMFSSLII